MQASLGGKRGRGYGVDEVIGQQRMVTVNEKTSLARLLSWPLHRSNTILERGYAEESQ